MEIIADILPHHDGRLKFDVSKKELIQYWHILGASNHLENPCKEIIRCKCYMSKSRDASVCYSELWVYGESWDTIRVGSGQVGGHGYYRPPHAILNALSNAGIWVYKRDQPDSIPRRFVMADDDMIKESFRAIGKKLGYNDVSIIRG